MKVLGRAQRKNAEALATRASQTSVVLFIDSPTYSQVALKKYIKGAR